MKTKTPWLNPDELQLHEHTVLNTQRSPAPKVKHSHVGGEQPHQHPNCGPAFYGYSKSTPKFTVKPYGQQLAWLDLEDWQRSFEVHLCTPTPGKGEPGYIGEGPGLLPVEQMVTGFKMHISRSVDHTGEERFYVAFRKDIGCACDVWEEDYASLEDAREAAEVRVDEKDADQASVTARHSRIAETYNSSGWSTD